MCFYLFYSWFENHRNKLVGSKWEKYMKHYLLSSKAILQAIEAKKKFEAHESMFCFFMWMNFFFLCWKNGRPYANIGFLACLSVWRLICIWVFLTSKWYSKRSVYWQEEQAIQIFQFNILKKKVSRNMRQKCVCLLVSFLIEWEEITLTQGQLKAGILRVVVSLVDAAFHESSS